MDQQKQDVLTQDAGTLKMNNHRPKDWSPLNTDNSCEESLLVLFSLMIRGGQILSNESTSLLCQHILGHFQS